MGTPAENIIDEVVNATVIALFDAYDVGLPVKFPAWPAS